jgi:hypothetical protein
LGFGFLLCAGAGIAQQSNIMGPDPGVQQRHGPLHFCGRFVAIDVAADEQIGWQRGPDFDLYFLESDHGGFGIYEGNYPDRGESPTTAPATVSGLRAERIHNGNGFSYLVQLPHASMATFVHLYGAVWTGDDHDRPLLDRVKIGRLADIGCQRPTFQN